MTSFDVNDTRTYLPICPANLIHKLLVIYCPSRKLAGEVLVEDEFTFQDLHNVAMWVFNIAPKDATFFVLNFHFESYFRSCKSQYQPLGVMKVLPHCWSLYESWPGSVYVVLLDMRNFSMRHPNDMICVPTSVNITNRSVTSVLTAGSNNSGNSSAVEKEKVFYDSISLNETGVSCTEWVSHQKFLADSHFLSLGAARQTVFASAELFIPTVDASFLSEIYARALKHGKLMKYITSKDSWKEEYFILDGHRLWYFIPPSVVSTSASSVTSSPSPSSSISTSSSINATAAAVSSASFGNSYNDITNMSFIDLDQDSEVTVLETSEGRSIFSGSNRSQHGAHGCVFTITYNQNTNFVTLKAPSQRSVSSWKRIIRLSRIPCHKPPNGMKPLSCASKLEDAFESIIRAEECIEANASCAATDDIATTYKNCSFVGMLTTRSIRHAFCTFLMMEQTSAKTHANLFRFWCYAEDFRRGHPLSTQAFKFSDVAPVNRAKSPKKKTAPSSWRQSLWGTSAAAVVDASDDDEDSNNDNFIPSNDKTSNEDQKLVVNQWAAYINYAFLVTGAPQCLMWISSDADVASSVLTNKLNNLIESVSNVITNANALLPADVLKELQDVVLLILACFIYPEFVKRPAYQKSVLSPSLFASDRLKAGKDVMSNMQDLDLDGTYLEYIEDNADTNRIGSSPARRSTLVPAMTRRPSTTPTKLEPPSPVNSTKAKAKTAAPTATKKHCTLTLATPWRRGMELNTPFGYAFDALSLSDQLKDTLFKSLDYRCVFEWLPHDWFEYLDVRALETHLEHAAYAVEESSKVGSVTGDEGNTTSFCAKWAVNDIPSLLHIRPPSQGMCVRSSRYSTASSRSPSESERSVSISDDHDQIPGAKEVLSSTAQEPSQQRKATPLARSATMYQTVQEEELQLQILTLLNLKNYPLDADDTDEVVSTEVCKYLDLFMKGISQVGSSDAMQPVTGDALVQGVWSQQRLATALNLIYSIQSYCYIANANASSADATFKRRSVLEAGSLILRNYCGKEKLLTECYKLNTTLLRCSYGVSLQSNHTLLGNVVLMTTIRCRYFPNTARYSGNIKYYINSTLEEKSKPTAASWLLNGLSSLPVAKGFSNISTAVPSPHQHNRSSAANANPNTNPALDTDICHQQHVYAAGDYLSDMQATAAATTNSAAVNKLIAHEDVHSCSQAWSHDSTSNAPSACRMATCVFVEWKGQGKIYVYDSTLSPHPFSIIDLDKVTKVSLVQLHLYGIELFDAYGLAWQLFPLGVDEDDAQTVSRRWLFYMSLYAAQDSPPGQVPPVPASAANGGANTEDRSSFARRGKQCISSAAAPSDTPSRVVTISQQGLLSKKGNFNTAYKKRYFVLDSLGKLRYYKTETGQLKGEIDMKCVLEVGCKALFPEASKAAAAVAFSVDNDDSNKRGMFSSISGTQTTSATLNKIDQDRSFYVRTQDRVWSFQANTPGEAARWVYSLNNSVK